VNITDADIVVYFREAGATNILATLPCYINDAANGVCYFNFPQDTLKDLLGAYEARSK
jgi:hypothetical protein